MQWRNNLATDGKTDSANNNIDDFDIESLDDDKTSTLKEDGAVAKKSNESNSGISLEPETK
jgi:hypothetical protein